jgi:hypothetical protein
MNILPSIENIFLKSKKSKLLPVFIKTDILKINRYLVKGGYSKLNMIESICFATIICKTLENETVDLLELSVDFGISSISVTSKLLPSIESLLDNGLIQKKISKRRSNEILRQKYYTVEPKIMNAIISQQPLPIREVVKWESSLDVLTEISLISRNLYDRSIRIEDVFETVNRLIEEESLKFPFIKWITNETKLKDESLILFCHVINQNLLGSTNIPFKEFSELLFINKVGSILFIQQLINGESPLIEKDLIKIHKSIFLDEIELQLTQKTITALSEEKLMVSTHENKVKEGWILPENIHAQQLFYNAEVEGQISALHELLHPQKYDEFIMRMRERKMPELLSIMLYGMPGTGKTELAKQLAANSNRPIMNVDLSKIKGSYFGESEKRVSQIFSSYEKLISNSEITPILLLNEADGILRNRSEINANSTVSGTEHLIQTTFLNCLENAKGIIIATTNFITNLDDAYDRRFLFKLELQKPNEDVRIKLLKNKIQSLTDDQTKALAQNYEVTGAQIENVLRKSEINFVLYGEQADYSTIQAYFEEEICLQHKTQTKIGF